MGIFGIGTTEMIVILVAALIIFGPGKLPEVAGQMGRAVRDFRRMTSELTGEFEKTISDASDIKRTINKELTGMKSQVASVSDSVKRDLSQSGADTKKSGLGSAKSTASSITSAKSKSGTSSVARPAVNSKASPLVPETEKIVAKVSAANGAMGPTVASKSDPFADLAIFAESVESPNTSPASARTSQAEQVRPASSPAAIDEVDEGDREGAVTRARQRRLNAGYNRQSN